MTWVVEFDKEIENIGKGWQPIVRKMHADVLEIDPDLKLLQIKEKFGGLRYYYASEKTEEVEPRVQEAERMCNVTCEECGKPGQALPIGTWWRTLCPEDEQAILERRRKLMEESSADGD